MNQKIKYMPEFVEDFNIFSKHDRNLIRAAINKLCEKPYSKNEGGFGTVVSRFSDGDLMSVKIIFTDIRIVYKIMKIDNGDSSLIIFASVSNDNAKSAM